MNGKTDPRVPSAPGCDVRSDYMLDLQQLELQALGWLLANGRDFDDLLREWAFLLTAVAAGGSRDEN